MNGQQTLVVKRTAYVTIVILFLSWLIDYIDRLIITLALPSIGKEFHLNAVAQGAILSIFFFSYALCQMPGGWLADRIGSKKTMTIAMVAWSVFTGLTGAAVNYVMLMAVRLFFGISEGIFPGASMKAIAERTTREMRLTANGLMIASNSFGAAIAPLIAAPFIIAVGWRHTFYWVAGLGIIMAIVLWYFLPKPLPSTAFASVDSPAATVSAEDRPAGGIELKLSDLLRKGVMWKFFLMFCGMDIIAWGLVSWVPSYLLTVKHISLAKAGALTSIPFFAGTISTILGGWLFDRYLHDHHRRIIVPSMILSAVFLFFMLNASSAGRFIFFETIAAFFVYLAFQPIFGLPMRLLSSRILGTGSAMINFGGQTGGVLSPLVMGWLVQTFSYQAAFAFLVFGAVLCGACALWIPESAEQFERALTGKRMAVQGTQSM
ncbi:MFS transporter [Alicyclobacillus macrosporangiidus]|uniref:MFS transporter n=1 Tax=Alicyclobacillus macrosporangiidus TaxID=392015 RepID=UPI0004974FC0|nr:MFS transporter [Alicyclobacillus macrosporangiidus]